MCCYLAHIGSFIPCRFAKIGLLDGIYCSFNCGNSIFKFTGEGAEETKNLNYILSNCTSRSLLLMDELGKSSFFLFIYFCG
jgi:DNA mismatch repair ATPase MutS